MKDGREVGDNVLGDNINMESWRVREEGMESEDKEVELIELWLIGGITWVYTNDGFYIFGAGNFLKGLGWVNGGIFWRVRGVIGWVGILVYWWGYLYEDI